MQSRVERIYLSVPSVVYSHYGIDIWQEIKGTMMTTRTTTKTTTITNISPGLLYSSHFSSETWIQESASLMFLCHMVNCSEHDHGQTW